MLQRRTDFTGPALIRLLARLTEVEVPESPQAFADRLSQWLGWTNAIALSTALNGSPAPATAPSADARVSPANAEEGECARVRAALTKSIAEDSVFAPLATAISRRPAGKAAATPTQAPAPLPADATPDFTDFTPYRLRYHARQQAMDAAIGPLREKLRSRLAARKSPALGRLAAIDAVMEQALGEQERRLLAGLPALLEKYFERLRRQHEAQQADNPDASTSEAAPWLQRFGKDAQGVLLAELELRYQPVEGLLQALRA
ncbi:DUF3348 domain-containing protein [Variovorax sp. LARHSF232]